MCQPPEWLQQSNHWPKVRSYLGWHYFKRLGDLDVQLLDIRESLDPAGGTAVGQLCVEHEFGPLVGRWRREPRAVRSRFIESPCTCVSAADLLVVHQMLLGRFGFLPPRFPRHIAAVFGEFLDDVEERKKKERKRKKESQTAATTLKWRTC